MIRIVLQPHYLRKPQPFRSIHLHFAATTKLVKGNHHIIEYEDFQYPHPKDFDLELWLPSPLRKQESKISLSNVIQDYLKPGVALLPLESKTKDRLPETQIPRYTIGELNTVKVYEPSPKKSKGRGSKEFHFRTDVDSGHFAHALYKSYHFLSKKNKSPVEIHIHHPLKKKKKDALPGLLGPEALQKRQETLEEQKKRFTEAVHKALHLWPETILRAMPEDSGITISPVANKDNVCWVMDLNGKDKNNRFLKARALHTERYENCEGLPDKETRRLVKQDVRRARHQIRSEIEAHEKEEKLSKLAAKNNSLDGVKSSFSPAQTTTESQKGEESQTCSISSKGFRSERRSFQSLVAEINIKEIKESKYNPALEQLKELIQDRVTRKGTVGLLEQCEFERLSINEMTKIYLIGLTQIKERGAELEYEKEHGDLKVRRENEMILERTANLYKHLPNARQLQEEIRRRLGTDMMKVQRRNKEKIEKELRRLMRRRQKILEIMDREQRKVVLDFEGGQPQIMYHAVKQIKPGWSYKSSRGTRQQTRGI